MYLRQNCWEWQESLTVAAKFVVRKGAHHVHRALLSGLAIVLILIAVSGIMVITVKTASPLTVDYLLTVVTATGALGGIAFALYGWYSAQDLPRRVERLVSERVQQAWDAWRTDVVRQQEALQKVLASYTAPTVAQRIALLEQAVQRDPRVYNGWTALGYAYLEASRIEEASHAFLEAARQFPADVATAADLVYFYTTQQEWTAALGWLRDALRRDPAFWTAFMADARYEPLRQARPTQCDALRPPAAPET
jgi:tetratricopeptide (TPR) repeat protein